MIPSKAEVFDKINTTKEELEQKEKQLKELLAQCKVLNREIPELKATLQSHWAVWRKFYAAAK